MSSRALRKLHGIQDDLPTVNPEECSSADEEIEVTPARNKSRTSANPFLALGEDNDDLMDQDEVENEKSRISEEEEEEKPAKVEERTGAKKKRRKKKKKSKDTAVISEQANHEDDIDASIREVNELLGELPKTDINNVSIDSLVTMDTKALLGVEHRQLNPDNEMRRIFGSQIVRSDTRRRGHGSRQHRSTWLVTPKSTWPPIGKTGLTMKHLSTKSGHEYFSFEHSKDYQQVQFKFLDAVESLNPNNIVSILNMHPYHIDSLIQLSEVCKMSEDLQMAAELTERALFSFECSFHVLFNLTQSNCRLEYRRQENRAFFLALFKHLVFVGQRGCYRTALEYCKLLLSLEPDNDPLCVILMIDFYALRSQQYQFLIRLYNEWENHRNLSQLPNFAFSVALAYFHMKRDDDDDHLATANSMIQNALLMFPSMLLPLLDKCSVQPDKKVTNHQFFGRAQHNQPVGLQQLVGLYIGRSSSVWKEPEVITWLISNVTEVLQRVDNEDPLVSQYSKKRQLRYQGTPTNILRHILVSEIQDASAALPPELTGSPVMTYDPYP
ncbi:ribosome quality control complex subunit TCF25-like [Ptychodera flava]|uniref:ribosome quality control complex subunit TCF25-like n=1 Tax=Ptychodera flava TaxID=63121 RepID=UPI003969DC29